MKRHYAVLDSFRGICACIVAFSHFNANSVFYLSPLLDRGAPYVDFFFVLSGFIIFANYHDKILSGYSLKKFMWLRFWRLYPLHFFVLAGFVVIDLLQLLLPHNDLAMMAPFSAPGESPKDIIAMIFLVHSLNISEYLAFNGPSWSISVEFYAYLLFAIIIVTARKYCFLILLCFVFCMPVLLFSLSGELYAKLDYGFLRCVYGFSCGSLTWMFYKKYYINIQTFIENIQISILEFSIICLVAIYISFWSDGIGSFVAPIIYSLIILVFSFEKGKCSDLLKRRTFLLLGTLSYSIYMTHLFISGKVFMLPVRIIENKTNFVITVENDGVPLYGTNIFYGTLIEIFYILVVIFLSFVSYKLIEEPFRNWSRRFINKEDK